LLFYLTESNLLTFSGVEKEAKRLYFIHSLAQRTNQETSTLTKASPYMERMQLIPARNRPPSKFLYGSQAFALKGEPWSFYRLAHNNFNNLYH